MVVVKIMYLKDKFYVFVENKIICIYYFEMYELVNVRKVLFGFNLIYLYYINIDVGDIFKKFNFLKINFDDLLYW